MSPTNFARHGPLNLCAGTSYYQRSIDWGYVNDNTPVIVQISWMGGGGHFAVCAYVYKSDQKCIFLDPWYGLVERAGSTLPAYTIGIPEFGTTPGKLNGWILVTRQ
jgi:hypothetical protein